MITHPKNGWSYVAFLNFLLYRKTKKGLGFGRAEIVLEVDTVERTVTGNSELLISSADILFT